MQYTRATVWPIVILVVGLLTLAMYLAEFVSPLRTLIGAFFVAVCPGMAYVRLLNLDEQYIEWTLAVALSFVIITASGGVLVYGHAWSISRAIFLILFVTFIGVALQVASEYRSRHRTG